MEKIKDENPQGIVYVVSLGCPKNLVDTEVMTGVLVTNGFFLTMDPEQADIYLINTCAFIPSARSEASEAVKEAEIWKAEAPDERKVIIAGCLIQWDKLETYREKFPAVDIWMGVDQVPNIANLLKDIKPSLKYLRNETPTFIYDETIPRLQLTLPHIAYLKIADGCDNRCSYCAIPDIRGDMRSRSLQSVISEAESALRNGATELLIMAQDITTFGDDRDDNEDLSALLLKMDKLKGKFWIRLLYTHPAHFPQKLIDTIAKCKHVLPYVDMPMQHISGKLLDSMHRHISEADTRDLLTRLRKGIPNLAIRTTFITGLPGETEEDFKMLKDFIIEQEFERLGVFAYSPEPGTPAASFDNQVSNEIAEGRAVELMEIQAKISLKKNKLLVGREFDVIVDFIEKFGAVGRTYMDTPEIDNLVVIPDELDLSPGQVYKTIITDADTYELTAKLKS
ncbi:MAG: 30S ribosomal protein S12 methylthiotransferase RimO [Victivallales bacterium]|nr:30S ribosomal protein S12 methylthiotransferase RimO [Victivallales bacterium]